MLHADWSEDRSLTYQSVTISNYDISSACSMQPLGTAQILVLAIGKCHVNNYLICCVSESTSRSHQHGEECVGQRVRAEQEEGRQHATFARERRRYRRRDAELSRHLRTAAPPSVVLSRERYGEYYVLGGKLKEFLFSRC